MHSRLLRLPLAVALATLLLCAQALATWSIVIVNTRTGEVCVASATCLPNFNLRKATPVVIPGVGVAAAQSYLDSIGNRLVIHNEMLDGLSPDQILEIIKDRDSAVRLRQYGMVDLEGNPNLYLGQSLTNFFMLIRWCQKKEKTTTTGSHQFATKSTVANSS